MRFKLLALLLGVITTLQAQNYISEQQPDFYFNEAISLYQSGDYTAAKQLIDKYLVHEETPEALYYRAMSAIRSEQKAGEYYVNSFVKNYPLHPLAHKAKFELGHHYFTKRNYQKALLTFGGMNIDALDKKQEEQAQFEKGYSLLQMKITNQGVEALKAAYEFNGDFKHESAYYIGVMSEGGEAEKWLLAAAEDEEWQTKSAIYLSQIYLNSGEYEKLQTLNQPILSKARTKENFQLHMYTGESYYQEEKYRQATRYYGDGLALGAGKADAETLFKIGHSYYEIGEKEKAIEQLKLSGLNETATGQASAFQLAKIYTEIGQLSSALNAYEIAGESDHDPKIQEEAQFLAGKISVQLGQFGQAIQKLESFLGNFPSSDMADEANELLSSAYLNTSNYDLVIAHFEKINSTSRIVKKNYQQVTLLKGMQSFSDRQVEVAMTYLRKSVQSPVDRAKEVEAYYWIGECEFILGNTDKAKTAYNKAKNLDSTNPLPEYGLGYLAYNDKDYATAKNHFQAFRNKLKVPHPFRSDATLRISDCDYALKNYDAALSGYNSLSGSSVAQDYIQYQIGLIHQLNGRVEPAVSAYMRVIEMQNSTYRDNALFQIAQTHFEDANFESSITAFTSYINQYPNENLAPLARIKRGLCYFNQTNFELAQSDYQFVLDNHITHPAAQNALLGIQELQKQGVEIDFETYLSVYRAAHPEDSSLETIEFEQGKALYFAAKYDQAVLKFEALLNSNPNGAFTEDIIYYLGDSYDKIGELNKANNNYEKIIAMSPSKYLNRVLDKRGKLLLTLGEGNKAIENYTLLKTQSKNRKENYLSTEGLMKSFFLTEDFQKSIEQGRMITDAEWKPSNAENEAFLYIGKSLIRLGDSTAAVDEFLKVINGSSDELAAEAKYRIGEIQFQQGNHQQSLETLFQLNSSYGAYQNWIGKSFLLIADNYIATEEWLQAKATLNSLIENFPNEGVKSQARAKLRQIEAAQNAKISQDTIK